MESNQDKSKSSSIEDSDTDPCTGFPLTYKAKLSITSIVNNRWQEGNEKFKSSRSTVVENKNSDDWHKGKSHLLGIFLTILSALTFSFNALLAKLLSHLHPFNLGVWTFLLMTLFASILIVYQWLVTKNKNGLIGVFATANKRGTTSCTYFYLFVRSFCGVSALTLFFYAVKYLPVADAIVIDASSPIFVYLMAFVLLGEKFGILPVFTTLLAFSGVTLIARPPIFTNSEHYDWNSLIGTILAFSAMFCIVTSIIALKFLDNVHQSVVNFAFGLWGSFQCILVSLICGVLEVPYEILDILKIISVAVLFYLGQGFITLALKYEDAGPVGLARTTEVVFIFIWQFLFLGVVPDAYSWCGAFLITIGVTLTIFRNWVNSLPEKSLLRHYCGLPIY